MGFSPAAVSKGYSLVESGMGFSLQRFLLLQSTGFGAHRLPSLQYMGSAAAAPRL